MSVVRRRYDEVAPGDQVRADNWPVFHEVVHIEKTIGLVNIDIAVGGLIEKLPPRPYHEQIEVDVE